VHEAETITDCDERGAGPQLWLLRFLRVVEVTLATDTLNFADPIGLRSVAAWTLLEVHLRILAQVDHGTKVISMTLEWGVNHGVQATKRKVELNPLERFEHFNQLDRAKDIRILGGDLDHHHGDFRGC